MATSDTQPWWATPVKMRLSNGRLVGVDGSMWAYRSIPMTPIVDARTSTHIERAAAGLFGGCEELAKMASTTANRRALNRNSYREVHMLAVNVPDRYRADPAAKNAAALNSDFGSTFVTRRVSVMGVKLLPRMRREGKSPLRAGIESVSESLVTGRIPLEDYAEDFAVVDAALTGAGLVPATGSELELATAWWNFGRAPNTPILVHADHLHVFSTVQAEQTAARMDQQSCGEWRIADSYAVSFAAVGSFENTWRSITDPQVLWASDLMRAGALAVSLRGLVEPAKVTGGEMRRHIRQAENDISERVAQGKQSKAEQEHDLAVLRDIEESYSISGGVATLTNTTITVALDGVVHDAAAHLPNAAIELGTLPLAHRQRAAMSEQMLASPVRANPVLHDLPIQYAAAAGFGSLSTVGDPEGAMLGLTETDRQPAYVSPSAVSDEDALPLMMVAGATGSGKTMVLLHLARQWVKIRNRQGEPTPVVFIDPKPDSDFSAPVEAMGGRVFSLDSLATADGVFDPLRVLDSPEAAVELASAMLGGIAPWPGGRQAHEVNILKALRFGITKGATCTGQALRLAFEAGVVGEDTVGPVFDLLEASPLFRAIFGQNPQGDTLRAHQGITLIKVGSQALPLPSPNDTDPPLMHRIGQWVLRMMVYASAAAVRGRQGVVMLDEAWQFVQGSAGREEVERLGRLARSMQVLPVLASQRVSDFTRAELKGYISRGILLGLDRGKGTQDDGTVDTGEAGAALDLFDIAKTEDRLSRMSASKFLEGSKQPNWHSLRALKDPETDTVVRGSIAFYVDLSGRVVPVEVTIPQAYLEDISTTGADVDARAARAREAAAAAMGAPIPSAAEPSWG